MSETDPVRIALYKLLKEDKTLQGLATGVFFELAPKDSQLPYVIFRKQSGVPIHSFNAPPLDRDRWLVKGVGTTAQAEAIHLRCRSLLESTHIEISGKYNPDIRRVSDVGYSEPLGTERVEHIGAEYKLDSEYEK